MQVVDKLQSGNKSKRDGWITELPRTGLGEGVIEKMKEEKRHDVVWQGKCSGTVYVCDYQNKLCISVHRKPLINWFYKVYALLWFCAATLEEVNRKDIFL